MIIRVIDFETTGMPPDAAVCEIGWCSVRTYDDPRDPPEVGDPRALLVDPKRPMPVEARAIHHISDRDLAGAADAARVFMEFTAGEPGAFAAHNATFERAFFAGGDTPWICTLKVARRLWPECPSHSNQCLRYFLGLELEDRDAMPPHRAGPDAFVTAHILRVALGLASVADMIAWTSEPSLLPRINFGKHRGKKWHEAPRDYLEWIVSKSDLDADVKFTAKQSLKDRAPC